MLLHEEKGLEWNSALQIENIQSDDMNLTQITTCFHLRGRWQFSYSTRTFGLGNTATKLLTYW